MRAMQIAGLALLAVCVASAAAFTSMNLGGRDRPADGSVTQTAQDLAQLGRGVDDAVLLDSRGIEVRWGALKERPRAVFFGFTHCAVVCPVTVWELHHAVEAIGQPADVLQIQFVTLDPERDTPQKLAKYFDGFDGRIDAFSGDRREIARIANAFDVTYRRVDEPGGQYTIDHTATVFLLNAQGVVVDVIAYGSPPEAIEARLRGLIAP
jgi:protein SCO1